MNLVTEGGEIKAVNLTINFYYFHLTWRKGSAAMHEHEKLEVVVKYPAAEKPFKHHVERHETVGQFKPVVLKAFGLTEGSGPGGSTTTYTLYHDKKPLDNMNETLGKVAEGHETLHLKLVQQITQG